MKIRNLRIQNLGSIKDISLDNLTDFSIIVGKNGSGKTYLFTGLSLFFKEFQIVGGDSLIKDDDYIWFRRKRSENITIEVSLELTEQEFREVSEYCGFSEDEIQSEIKNTPYALHVIRELQFGRGWKTSHMQLCSNVLVEQDTISSNLPPAPTPETPDLSPWRIYLFDPDASKTKLIGARLLVNEDEKIAYHSKPELDSLVSSHGLSISDDYKGQNHKDWATQQGFQLIEKPPTNTEAQALFELVSLSKQKLKARAVAPDLTDFICRSFQMIPVARDSRETTGFRTPLLDEQYSTDKKNLSLSTDLADETKWGTFGNDVELDLTKRFEPNPQQVLVIDKNLRLPLAQLGGGEQSLIALKWSLLSGSKIYAIEEPENHLHPDLARKLFRYFKLRSSDTQILISTHSHFLIDKDNPSSNWRLYIDGQQTMVDHCQENNDLRSVLIDLGVLPSDIYFRDLVVFVEGGTEKEAVFPIWARKLGLNLSDNLGIGLISIGGESKLKANLRIWLEVIQHAPADYLVVLDHHSAALASDINREMGIPMDRFVILAEHAIEDYYQPRHIVEALKALYDIDVDSKELHKKDGESRAQTIKSILEKEGKIENGWKVLIGTTVASKMKTSEIPDEFKSLINRIVVSRK